jgi:hypothetical protein
MDPPSPIEDIYRKRHLFVDRRRVAEAVESVSRDAAHWKGWSRDGLTLTPTVTYRRQTHYKHGHAASRVIARLPTPPTDRDRPLRGGRRFLLAQEITPLTLKMSAARSLASRLSSARSSSSASGAAVSASESSRSASAFRRGATERETAEVPTTASARAVHSKGSKHTHPSAAHRSGGAESGAARGRSAKHLRKSTESVGRRGGRGGRGRGSSAGRSRRRPKKPRTTAELLASIPQAMPPQLASHATQPHAALVQHFQPGAVMRLQDVEGLF